MADIDDYRSRLEAMIIGGIPVEMATALLDRTPMPPPPAPVNPYIDPMIDEFRSAPVQVDPNSTRPLPEIPAIRTVPIAPAEQSPISPMIDAIIKSDRGMTLGRSTSSSGRKSGVGLDDVDDDIGIEYGPPRRTFGDVPRAGRAADPDSMTPLIDAPVRPLDDPARTFDEILGQSERASGLPSAVPVSEFTAVTTPPSTLSPASSGLEDDEDLNFLQRFAKDKLGLDADARSLLAQALIAGGGATMAGSSSSAGQNIGEGLMAGVLAHGRGSERKLEEEESLWDRAREANEDSRAEEAHRARLDEHRARMANYGRLGGSSGKSSGANPEIDPFKGKSNIGKQWEDITEISRYMNVTPAETVEYLKSIGVMDADEDPLAGI